MKLQTLIIGTILSTGLVCMSCDDKSRISNPNVREEIRARKPVKLSAGQITEGGLALGSTLSKQIEDAWISRWDSAMASGEPLALLTEFCKIETLPVYKQITDNQEVEINRSALQPINPAHEAKDLSLELAEAYQYNIDNNLPLTANLQKYNENQFLVTSPITVNRSYCISCHGHSAQLATGIEQKFSKDYSAERSEAIKMEQGSLVGLWNVSFPRSMVVKQLSSSTR